MGLLGKGGILQDVKLCLQIADLGGGLPFQFNKSINQLEAKSKRKLYILGLRLGIATLYMIVQFAQAYRVLNVSSSMVITHDILYIITAVLILSCELVNYTKLSGVVQLFNGFIQLEQNFMEYFGNRNIVQEQKSITAGWLIRGMIFFLTFTGLLYPVIYAADILRNPCFPAYAGYLMSPQCEYGKPGYYLDPTWSLQEILTKTAMSLTSLFLWAPFIAGWLYLMSLEYVVEGNCFRVNIADYGKALMRIQKENTRNLKKLTLFHRQLQIMSIHYRLYLSQFQTGCAIPCVIVVQAGCLMNSISLISGRAIGGPIWYNLLYVWAAIVFFSVVIFIFGILADVYNVSNEVQRKVNGRYELKRNKWFKRWMMSCPNFKISFGGSNFLDRLTPLNIQDFAINQTVSLMLLQK